MKRAASPALAALCGAALAAGIPAAAAAASRPVDCEITVGGRTFAKQVCRFIPRGGGGFQVEAGAYFAQVDVNADGTAEVNWNEIPEATHAQAYLGTARRQGACWVSERARICARDLPPARRKALMAAAPAGGSLQLVGAGYPCLAAEGHRAGAQVRVALQACRFPADNIWIRGQDGALAISRHPDLCLMAEAPGMGRPLQMVLAACRPGLPRWRVERGPEGGAVRSDDGLCLTVPKLADPDAKFPYEAGAAPCSTAAVEAARFDWEAGE